MNIGRNMLALLIALSVAMLPGAGGASVAVKSADATEMSAMEDMDCCPHKVNPRDEGMNDCSSMATCALKYFSYSGTASSNIIFPSVITSLGPSFWNNPFHSQRGSPPFRPPRA